MVPFGIGYYLSYLYRSVNVMIGPDLARDLSLDASDLGLLTSIYFILFASFQLPLGILLDRYGPRRVQVLLLLVAASGGLMFAWVESFGPLVVARGLIGLGVSGCLMAALKANAMWWPTARLPLINGCTVAFGSIGALSATVPVEMALHLMTWRGIFVVLAVLTVACALLVLLAVPERRAEVPQSGMAAQLSDLGLIYGNGYFWRLSILIFVHNGAFLAYQTLWMGPWLRDVAGMDQAAVAASLLWFNVGMLVGVVSLGIIADWLQRAGVSLMLIIGSAIAVSIAVQGLLAAEVTAFATLLCVGFGFFGSSSLLGYAIFAQYFPIRLVGRASTAQNMLVFSSAFIAQWGIGVIIDLWPVVKSGGYDPAAHQAAFAIMVGIEILAFIWFLVPRRQPPPPA